MAVLLIGLILAALVAVKLVVYRHELHQAAH
jgi:hypothetical protein